MYFKLWFIIRNTTTQSTPLFKASTGCSISATKVLQKIHIRKQSEELFIKKIDIYLTARYTPAESLLASRCVAGCGRGVADFYK